MDDMAYMEQALALAREAALEGEVPVGCVIALGFSIFRIAIASPSLVTEICKLDDSMEDF